MGEAPVRPTGSAQSAPGIRSALRCPVTPRVTRKEQTKRKKSIGNGSASSKGARGALPGGFQPCRIRSRPLEPKIPPQKRGGRLPGRAGSRLRHRTAIPNTFFRPPAAPDGRSAGAPGAVPPSRGRSPRRDGAEAGAAWGLPRQGHGWLFCEESCPAGAGSAASGAPRVKLGGVRGGCVCLLPLYSLKGGLVRAGVTGRGASAFSQD